RDWRGEIVNRLERVGRYHPSRTIVIAVERGRSKLSAWATMSAHGDPEPGSICVCEERVEIEVGPEHVALLATIVDPLVVQDLSTVVWAPHGHDEAVDALLDLADVNLLDSVEAPDPASAIGRAQQLLETGYVVDLAWLRSAPWRERIAATFDPPPWRGELGRIDEVTVHHRDDSAISALLLVGWLASRLGWEPGAVVRQNGSMLARARGRGQCRRLPRPRRGEHAAGLVPGRRGHGRRLVGVHALVRRRALRPAGPRGLQLPHGRGGPPRSTARRRRRRPGGEANPRGAR